MNSSPNLRTSISLLISSHYTLLKGKAYYFQKHQRVLMDALSASDVSRTLFPSHSSQCNESLVPPRRGQCLCAGLTSHCRWDKVHRRYLYPLLSVTLRREMGPVIYWRAERCQAAVNINLFHCCSVCASILQQQKTRLAIGSPSNFWKRCWVSAGSTAGLAC